MVSTAKDPAKVRAGAIGAQKRWAGHSPRIIRLDDLAPEQRAFVAELVDVAKRNAKAVTEGQSPVTADQDVSTDARPAG